jgi:hypothetical protein
MDIDSSKLLYGLDHVNRISTKINSTWKIASW